jgi:HNH endonuclease
MTSTSRYRNDLTAERVRELFHYDPLTGFLSWRVDRTNHVKAGDRTGCIDSNGYIRITINRTTYLAHRLIWLWQTGSWPSEEIDHVNRIKDDNRWVNLREASHGENRVNSLPRDKLSDLPCGVQITLNGKFRAKIAHISIGTFDTVEEAANAYALAASALYGDFYQGAPAIATATTAATVETTPRLWRRL